MFGFVDENGHIGFSLELSSLASVKSSAVTFLPSLNSRVLFLLAITILMSLPVSFSL